MKTCYVFLADGFEEVEALTCIDVMRRAGMPVTTVSINPDLEVSDDSLIIASLLHDVCKAPRYQGSTKAGGVYQKNYNHLPVGHGEKSVIMLLRLGLELTDDEIMAIRWHMGAWQIALHNEERQQDYVHATHTCPLLSIIEAADKLAAQILEVKP